MSFSYLNGVDVYIYLVHFFKTIFEHGLSKSVLQSPAFDATPNACLKFRYQISSPKIMLKISKKATVDSNFVTTETFLFSGQGEIGSWSHATVRLGDDTIQFQVTAVKTGVSNNIHYAMIDSLLLSSCSDKGNNNILITITTAWRLIGRSSSCRGSVVNSMDSHVGNLGFILSLPKSVELGTHEGYPTERESARRNNVGNIFTVGAVMHRPTRLFGLWFDL